MSAEEMMRLTRTVVLRALLGADLGPFAAKVDDAWTIINQHVGESFWSLGLHRQVANAEVPTVPGRAGRAPRSRRSRHQPTPAQPV